MFARVSTYEGNAEDFDMGAEKVKSDIMPRLRSMPGSKGFLLMVDRSTGRSLSIALWESQEALDGSRTAVEDLRSQAAEGIGSKVTSVDEYEVGVADLT